MKFKQIVILFVGLVLNLAIVVGLQLECPWKKNLDIECAGCGATRMFKAILRLEFYQAFRYNPLLFSLLVIGIIYLIYVLIAKMLKKKYIVLGSKTAVVVVVLLVLFMVLRNISMFDFLKPTVV